MFETLVIAVVALEELFHVAISNTFPVIEAVFVIENHVLIMRHVIVSDHVCDIFNVIPVFVKVLPEKDQVEARNQVNQDGMMSVIVIQELAEDQLFQ
jgi:hypothetical protein